MLHHDMVYEGWYKLEEGFSIKMGYLSSVISNVGYNFLNVCQARNSSMDVLEFFSIPNTN